MMQSSLLLSLCLVLPAILISSSQGTLQQLHCDIHQRDYIFAEIAPQDCYDAWKRGMSFVDEVLQYYDTLCQPDCLAALAELAQHCGTDQEASLKHLQYECAKNEKGIGCYKLAAEDSGVMYNVYAKCWNETVCGSECHAALEHFRDTHGCCVNTLYNSTSSNFDYESVLSTAVYYGVDMGVVRYSLWERCGITTPGFCNMPRELTSGGTGVHVALAAVVGIIIMACLLL